MEDEKARNVSVLFFHISKAGEGDLEDVLPESPDGLKSIEDFITQDEEDEIEREVRKKLNSSGPVYIVPAVLARFLATSILTRTKSLVQHLRMLSTTCLQKQAFRQVFQL